MDDFTKFGINIFKVEDNQKVAMAQLGSVAKDMFDGFVEAGFKEDQALALTQGIINSAAKK